MPRHISYKVKVRQMLEWTYFKLEDVSISSWINMERIIEIINWSEPNEKEGSAVWNAIYDLTQKSRNLLYEFNIDLWEKID